MVLRILKYVREGVPGLLRAFEVDAEVAVAPHLAAPSTEDVMVEHLAHPRLETSDGAGERLLVIGFDDEVNVVALNGELEMRKSSQTARIVRITCPMARAITCSRKEGSPFAARMVMCAGTCRLSEPRARCGVLVLSAFFRPAFGRNPPRPRRRA